MKKATVLLSGGIDSTTLLHMLRLDGVACDAVSFLYKQMHAKEIGYAQGTATRLGVAHTVIELPNIFAQSALLGDKAMPTGHYTDASMRATVVPNRNMVFLAIAASLALQTGSDAVAIAAHADDFGTYPDCRPTFIEAMRSAIAVCDYKPLELVTPYINWRKREIVALGRSMGIDYEQTWSCYAGGEVPCGECGACSARREALV